MPRDAKLPLWADKSTEQKLDALRTLVDELYGYILRDDLQQILDLLASYQSLDEDEEERRRDQKHLETITAMIYKHPTIASRGCEPAHLVGSALVIDRTTGKVLLHRHKKLNTWLHFGGHARYETDFAQVALREAMEESGLTDLKFFPDELHPRLVDVDVHTIPERNEVPQHEHLDLRFLLATSQPQRVFEEEARREREHGLTALLTGSGEGSDFEWLTCEQALNRPLLVANVRPLIRKAQVIYREYAASQPSAS